MAAYAPLLVNVNPGGMQWSSDLIGYDALTSYGSPSYYAQVMFGSCLGDHTMSSSLAGAGDRFFYSATASPGKLCLKMVNATSTDQSITLALRGAGPGNHIARIQTLRANTTWATNTIREPERIVPMASTANAKGERMQHVVPGYSIQVVELDLK
jgi:alpha-N-arabinofuranosidase